MALERLIERARKEVGRTAGKRPAEAAYAKAANEALDLVEKHSATIEVVGTKVAARFLGLWCAKGEDSAAEYLRSRASAAEVIASMKEGAQALEETRERREREQALVDLAKELGKTGVKLALGLLMA